MDKVRQKEEEEIDFDERDISSGLSRKCKVLVSIPDEFRLKVLRSPQVGYKSPFMTFPSGSYFINVTEFNPTLSLSD